MPAALSKSEVDPEVAGQAAAEQEAQRRRDKIVSIINTSAFFSVLQHMITLQSEPMLVNQLCNGNTGEAARLLANTQGLVGILSLFVNQAGGRSSDAVGRKFGLLLGPVANIILGPLVFANAKSKYSVLICRMFRMILTTFSSTVMCVASLTDTVSGKELGAALSKMGALVGLGVIISPVAESLVLKRFNHPKFSYLAMSFIATLHLAYNVLVTPETLDVAKRASFNTIFTIQSINPFGFMKIYTKGSKALQSMVNITSFQMFLEGKNLSDFAQIWLRNHVGWGTEGIKNFVVVYGILCMAAGTKLTPYLIQANSAEKFTTITNSTNGLAYFLRGLSQNPIHYLMVTPLLLAGVNGASASALKSKSTGLALKEGFGMGEFSAYTNNLRALAGAVAPIMYGNVYALCAKNGIFPGRTWWVAGFMGAVLPQLLLMSAPKEDAAK